MSDTTPRPDETPGDPTAPAQPADVEVTEVVPAPADAVPTPPADAVPTPPADAVPPPPPVAPPAYAQPEYAQPEYAQPQYAQPQYAEQPPPPVYPAPGTAVAGPNPISPADERTWGTIAHGGTLAATILSGGTLGFVCALVVYLLYKDRGPFVRHHSANALNVQIFAAILVIGGIILTVTVIGAIIGIPMIVLGGLYVLIVHIIGAIKA
ncbi:MAG TPA: DUF4870 domain-containing protein, partial [Ornithinibacter sp.]|nr:DUF4870 domain-containing protein [Ornithinibacter sp.]